MEQLYFFVLGVVTVCISLLIVGTLRVKNQVEDLKNQIKNLNKTMENYERYIEDKFRITENLLNTVDVRIDTETRELYRTMDSRFDKLENKLTTKK
jgi:uncharacterized membrane-anchored protein YhcB (DUF1043 family)